MAKFSWRDGARRGSSKASLMRVYVRKRIRALPPLASDPLARMAGLDDFDPVPVDDVVYE